MAKESKIINLSENSSLISQWVSELRDVSIQGDRMRFRRNLERIGEAIAFEISKILPYKKADIQTPLGIHHSSILAEQPVLCTILRAGLPLHQGMLNYFDQADNSFMAAYRKHTDDTHFEISLEYVSCPDLSDRILIISDPMLATGASLVRSVDQLKSQGKWKELHIVCAIASKSGINYVAEACPDATIWCADVDESLSDKGYILPGLGDAGDLAFGTKMQH
jgi:uracil phosphoribosyltransferase